MFRKVAFPCVLISGVVLCLLFSTEAQAQVFPRLSNWFQISSPCVTFTDAPFLVYYAGERRSIFNGKDLDGWTNSKGELPGKGWKVEDGMIFRESGSGDLYLQGEYENFVLEFEFKISKKGNSGVKYRSWAPGLGCEYQVYDDINDPKNPPRYQTASLYDVVLPKTGTQKLKAEEFNKGKIIVMGNHIEHYLNDELIMSIDVGTEEWKKLKEASKFKDMKEFGDTTVGRIFLQDHGCQVWFKNLYITELNPVANQCRPCFRLMNMWR